MSKKIIISESSVKLLNEAMLNGFSIDALRSLPSFKKRVDYCKQYLGNPVGAGSSRVVFQIDDETVLKLAKNNKGIAQNESEYYKGNDWYISHVFPNVYNGSDEKNFMWIISEYVLPAKEQDFDALLYIDFFDVQKFIRFLLRSNRGDKEATKRVMEYFNEYENDDDVIELFNMLQDLLVSYEMGIGDFERICNWGMVMRDGHPKLLPIDAGFTEEVARRYYRR